MAQEHKQPAERAQQGERLTLEYCRRCGALHVKPEGEGREKCPACRRALEWIFEGVRR